MLYLARQEHNDEEAPFVVLQQENLCVACLWTEWHHRHLAGFGILPILGFAETWCGSRTL